MISIALSMSRRRLHEPNERPLREATEDGDNGTLFELGDVMVTPPAKMHMYASSRTFLCKACWTLTGRATGVPVLRASLRTIWPLPLDEVDSVRFGR